MTRDEMVYPGSGPCWMHPQPQPGMFFALLMHPNGIYETTWNYPSHIAAFCAGRMVARGRNARFVGIGRWK